MTQRIPFAAEHLAVGIDLNGEGRNLKYGTIIDGSAMRYIRKDSIETGESGYRKIVQLGTNLKVDSLFGSKSARTKSLWAKSGTSVFHTTHQDNTKYTVGLIQTATERNFFIEGYNGDIFTFNQTDAPARVATAALIADTANDTEDLNVGLNAIDKFLPAPSTVYVRGSPVAYSGKSGGTLTGLSGIPAGGVATGDLCTQISTPSTFSLAKGTCGMIIEESMLVAGIKGAENVVYISAPSDLDNPEFLWDFVDNGADAKIMDNPVTAMIRGTSLGYIFGESYIKSTPGFNVENNVLVTRDVEGQFGAYNARCVMNMGGRAVCLGGKRLLALNVALNDGVTPQVKVDENFDSPIRPWLERFDDNQTDHAFCSYDPVKGLATIGGRVDGSFKVRRFDARDGIRAFTPEDIRPIRSYTFFDGKGYFGNNSTDKIYADNEGFTNDGFPILHYARTSRMEARGNKGEPKEVLLDYLILDGFMSKGCEFTVNIYANGIFSLPAYTINLTDSIITSTQGVPIGDRPLSTSVPGGDVTAIPQKKYPFEVTLDLTGVSGEDFSIELVCSKLAAYLQWKSFMMEGDGLQFTSHDRY